MIESAYQRVFRGAPEVVVRAPGRVNLIGEHTDYNDGYVLPVAIDRYVWFAGRKRRDRTVRANSLDFKDAVAICLDNLSKGDHPSWANYLQGVLHSFEADGRSLAGADLVFGGDVPREAGLSSSAAVEVGTAVLWQNLMGWRLDPVYVARITQRAENEFVGVPSGIMDQFVSACGRKNHALFLDCRDLEYSYVPFPQRAKIVVCNSGVKRALAHSEYEVRVKQCQQAVAQLSAAGRVLRSLRDVDRDELAASRHLLSDLLFRRARHVVTENERVLEAVKVLQGRDVEKLGQLMSASHESLRDDYEVSAKELDVLVELAWKQPGVIGSRMTGGGFGGCTVNLVRYDRAEDFAQAVAEGYTNALGLKAETYIFSAASGALAAGENGGE